MQSLELCQCVHEGFHIAVDRVVDQPGFAVAEGVDSSRVRGERELVSTKRPSTSQL